MSGEVTDIREYQLADDLNINVMAGGLGLDVQLQAIGSLT